MVTQQQFNNALRNLCIKQYSYMSEKYPASVCNIIFPRQSYKNDAKILLQYFYQIKGKSKPVKKLMFINNINIETHSFDFWKLQDYVSFIRTERDKMFPNNYKKKSRKFISNYPYVRSSLLSQYEKELYEK